MGHSWTALHALADFLEGKTQTGTAPGLNDTLAEIRAERGLGARACPDIPRSHYEVGYYRPIPPVAPYLSIIYEESAPLDGDVNNGTEDGRLTCIIMVRDVDVDGGTAGVGLAIALYEEAITRMMRRGSHGGQDRPRGFQGWNLNGYPGIEEARLVRKAARPVPELQNNNLALGVVFLIRTQEAVN